VWQRQPLVLVNHTGTATANDVNTLAQHITSQVYQRYGVTLEREVIYIH
ncbi:MAG: UDP-N-acetylmuramate dehydrogenase, partial [Muribaculaceae bacterium]|nr:UDP-N-acetylmuramate dehydrogenase [Muribaculaceae bacterium]